MTEDNRKLKLLVLRITEKCNLACEYCYAGCSMGGDMPLSIAIKAVERAVRPGEAIKIQFTGGEPLLNAGLIEAVYDFGIKTGRKLSLALQTNGTLLTRKNCLLLKRTGCSVGVSLDGMGNMNRLRHYSDNRQSFTDVYKGIMNLKDCGMMCTLMSVITDANAASLDKLLDLAFYMGNIYGVGLDIFRELGRGIGRASEFKAAPDDFASGLRAMLSKYDKYIKNGIHIHIKELDKYKLLMKMKSPVETDCSYCYAQTELSEAVNPKGLLYPCSSLCFDEYCYGSLDSGEIKRNICGNPLEECISCVLFKYCRGGCPANNDKTLVCVLNKKLYEYCSEVINYNYDK